MIIGKVKINNREFVKTIPSDGYILKKKGTNEEYAEALDLEENKFEYEETEDKIITEEVGE